MLLYCPYLIAASLALYRVAVLRLSCREILDIERTGLVAFHPLETITL